MSAATSYLAVALDRPNLDVVVNTRVTKVFPIGHEQGKPVFRGVQLAQDAGGDLYCSLIYAHYLTRVILSGPFYNLTASKEVILSAGATNTPHICAYLWH